ncbi:MAG: cell division protein FtsL [Clostridia bacterium]
MAYKEIYQIDSLARKKDYEIEESIQRKVCKNKPKLKVKPKKNHTSLMVFIIFCFGLTMLVTYRYNVINEKNLESQKLKKHLDTAESALLNAQIEVEQNTDLNKIESYAKQQLGMQKPDKNQTIYVDTSKTSKIVEVAKNEMKIEKFFETVINTIKNIF